MARTETYWQARISRPDVPAIPVWMTTLRDEPFYLTPRQFRLVRVISSGIRTTVRDLGQQAGYGSTAGTHRALRHLDALGVIKVWAERGRHGFTRARMRPDATAIRPPKRCPKPPAKVANVRTTSTGRTMMEKESTDLEVRTLGRAAFDALGKAWGLR